MSERTESLAGRIDAVIDELDEILFDALREAAAVGVGRPADDKRLLQARRALEKASTLLRARDVDAR